MFDINCLTLKEANNNQLQTISGFGENCFNTTLRYTLESQSNMIEVNKQLYRSLLEANEDIVLVNESFADFTSKIVIILDKFIKFIGSLWDRFIRAFNSLTRSDNYLLKQKDVIDKFNTDCEFTYEDYNYTIDQESKTIPIVDIKPAFQVDMMYMDTSAMDSNKTDEEKLKCIKTRYEEFKQKVNNEYYDSVRATVIGKSGGKISASQYAKELFKVFRNDTDEKDVITIKDSNVKAAYQFVTNYKTALKSVEDTQREIVSQYTDIKNYIQSLLKVNKNGSDNKVSIGFDDEVNGKSSAEYTVNPETLKYLNLFIKAKSEQVQQFSNIHSQAFSAKLQAFKDCYQSSKAICYQAINAVNKLHLNESVENIDDNIIEESFDLSKVKISIIRALKIQKDMLFHPLSWASNERLQKNQLEVLQSSNSINDIIYLNKEYNRDIEILKSTISKYKDNKEIVTKTKELKKWYETIYHDTLMKKKKEFKIKNESVENIHDYDEYMNETVLSSKQRNDLDSDIFGIPSLRKYPLNNKRHVSSAITYFNKVDSKHEAELAKNIKKRIKELGMSPEVSSSNRFSKYYKSPKKESANECTLNFV